MDVNALNAKAALPGEAASPAVPSLASAAANVPRPAIAPARDVVAISSDNGVSAADSALVANSSRNIGSGSKVFRDDSTDRFIIQIVNDSNEVIRQVPPEELIRIAQRFRQITGILFDEVV